MCKLATKRGNDSAVVLIQKYSPNLQHICFDVSRPILGFSPPDPHRNVLVCRKCRTKARGTRAYVGMRDHMRGNMQKGRENGFLR